MQQLDLFSTLPLAVRIPRRLRRLGFDLELVRKDIAILEDCCRDLDRNSGELAVIVAEARAAADVLPPNTYRTVVKSEDIRDRAVAKLKDCDALCRALERQLERGIERQLARALQEKV